MGCSATLVGEVCVCGLCAACLYAVHLPSAPACAWRHGAWRTSHNWLCCVVLCCALGLQVLKNEGAKSLFKGAGANILRAVAGAGVLSGYDQLQVIMFGEWCRRSS